MKKAVNLLISLTCITILIGCASAIKVRSLTLENADISRFSTYRFVDSNKELEKQFKQIRDQYVEDAIRYEMLRRGFTESQEDAALIHYEVVEKDRIGTKAIPTGRIGYRLADGRIDSGIGYSQEIVATQYTEQTVRVEFIEASSAQVLWEGSGTGRIRELTNEQARSEIERYVNQIFDRFPVRLQVE